MPRKAAANSSARCTMNVHCGSGPYQSDGAPQPGMAVDDAKHRGPEAARDVLRAVVFAPLVIKAGPSCFPGRGFCSLSDTDAGW